MTDTYSRHVRRLYFWLVALIFGAPILCGCIVITSTWLDARHNVAVWRLEFQFALEQLCPESQFRVTEGEGSVYLDAYQLDYQWHGDSESCYSNGRTVRCTCSPDNAESLVMSAQEADE